MNSRATQVKSADFFYCFESILLCVKFIVHFSNVVLTIKKGIKMVKIADIVSAIPNCEVVGTVVLNSGIRTYANNGKFVNIHLANDDEQIKLTAWGDDTAKILDLEVYFVIYIFQLLVLNLSQFVYLCTFNLYILYRSANHTDLSMCAQYNRT